MHTINYELLYPTARLPEASTTYSAGLDAYACLQVDDTTGRPIAMRSELNAPATIVASRTDLIPDWGVAIPGGWRALIPLGFKAGMPPELECQVRPRSGLAWKHGISIANTPGTIDADYPDEWMVVLENRSRIQFRVQHGDRIAQLVVARRVETRWHNGLVSVSTERVGGFGSTGV